MKVGTTNIIDLKSGDTQINKVYNGTDLVWEKTPPTPEVDLPIGALEANLKSFTGVPSYSNKWVECNGQVLNDPESPLNGQTIPNLNGASGGTKRFLMGGADSERGTTGGAETNTHSHSTTMTTFRYKPNAGGALVSRSGTGVEGSFSNLPPYYEVVWIMKIK